MAMSTRRDQITIMADMLDIIQQPQRLTHLLYRSNMSYGQLVKYLSSMKQRGMIEELTIPFRAYKITSRGKIFLQMIANDKFQSSPNRE